MQHFLVIVFFPFPKQFHGGSTIKLKLILVSRVLRFPGHTGDQYRYYPAMYQYMDITIDSIFFEEYTIYDTTAVYLPTVLS